MLKILALSLLILTSACAQNAKVAKLDPSEWTELKCSGFLTWNACRQEAKAICPKGYYSADYFENYTIQRREISIACKS